MLFGTGRFCRILEKGEQEYSRIRLTGQEREDFQTEAGLILVEMNKLFRQETGGVQGMGCSRVCTNVFREDVVESSTAHDAILEEAPNREGRYIRVPKAME